MEKPFGFWHKGAILNLQGCKRKIKHFYFHLFKCRFMRYIIGNLKIYSNMDNIFLAAGIISVIYFISKFLEMQYVDKEPKPLKILIRDSLLVYISSVLGWFVIDQLKPVINDIDISATPLAFTDNAPF
jgi:hypothetical protein